jgi:gliding motility-associated lipoprotein GldH
MKWVGFLVLSMLTFSACTPEAWKGEIQHPDQIWTYADSLVIQPEISDTQQVYAVWLDLQVNAKFQYRNLFVHQLIIPPGDSAFQNIQEFTLQAEDGTWLVEPDWFGSARFQVPLLQGFKFQTPGVWTFSIAQFMRKDTLLGVEQVRWYLKKE